MAPEDWQPRLSSDCHIRTGMSSCSHMNIHIFRNTRKAIWVWRLYKVCLNWHPLQVWTLDQCPLSLHNLTSDLQKQRHFSVTCHQALLCVLKYFATSSTYASVAGHYGLFMHLSFTRANADTSELVFVLLLSRTHPVMWACYNTLIDLPFVFIAF